MNSNVNLKALRIAYNQYFESIDVMSDVQLLSLHYKFSELMTEEITSWDDIRLNDFLVWYPFESISPNKVFDFLLSSYSDVIGYLGLDDNTIIINKLEAANVLSHNVVVAEFKDTQTKYEYADTSTGDAVYTPIAQELYDEFFAYYIAHLEELALV